MHGPPVTCRAVCALASPGASEGLPRPPRAPRRGGRHQLLLLPQRPTFRGLFVLCCIEGGRRVHCLPGSRILLANILGFLGLGARVPARDSSSRSAGFGETVPTHYKALPALWVLYRCHECSILQGGAGGRVTTHLLTKSPQLNCGIPGLLPR